MIVSLIVISLAFAWLLYESDWMRVRLIVGAMPQLEPVDRIRLYRTLTGFQIGISRRDHNTWIDRNDTVFSPGITEPICGWGWILNYEHPLVEYKIAIQAWGCKHDITLDPAYADMGKLLKEVCAVALRKPRKHNNHRKHKKGHTFNPYYCNATTPRNS